MWPRLVWTSARCRPGTDAQDSTDQDMDAAAAGKKPFQFFAMDFLTVVGGAGEGK